MMGWECPKCGGVYAPSVTQCDRCTLPSGTVANCADRCTGCGRTRDVISGTGCPPGWHYGTFVGYTLPA